MCLFPRLIKNKKYTPNAKNGGVVPPVSDPRLLYVPIKCGNCIECKLQNANQWKSRLIEEANNRSDGKFVTLTFSNESIKEIIENFEPLKKVTGYTLDNAIATRSIHLFRERWRKEFKKSIRHFLVTELGHAGTENIHLHGLLWTKEPQQVIAKIWKYGFVWAGYEDARKNYVNAQTANYIVKYIHKQDEDHPNYKSIVLTSPGIGQCYTDGFQRYNNIYRGENTDESYRLENGHKIGLNVYWRNKLFTEEQKEQLWLNKLNKNERWVMGNKVDADDTEGYYKILNQYRKLNTEMGFGNYNKDWDKIEYENKRRELLLAQRLENANKKNKIIELSEEDKKYIKYNNEYNDDFNNTEIQF